ncbi:hypothetical protein JVT61DRAFT_8596 [Boletus reticuloceps]|uniref:Transmembrane protein n=1 Tax=Boletus reticuloceps TaxID=495285 RepID=A0A8I2YXE1_9AGAM|nr:hypothetical protein JVT61DRAFT_8596 [Boletus reticuloceps]
MEPRTLHALEFTVAIIGQTLLLAAGWGFLGTVFVRNPLIASDPFSDFINSKPTVTTWIVTLVATVVSVATTTFLSITFKEALRHRMHEPISLIHLSSGITLTRSSFVINLRHLTPTIATLVVFGLTRLLVSSWTALLTPTRVTWSLDASGWELDLNSSSFESALQLELVKSGIALVRGNSTEIFNLNGVLSGIAAAQYSFGHPGIFNFNGVEYNISTGGVLPAAPGYNGTTDVSNNNTGLAFAGGQVPTNLYAKGHAPQGQSRTFTLQQQGLTANVTCRRASDTAGDLNFQSSFNPIPVPLADGTIDYWLWVWNITGNCSEGQPSVQHYVTQSNSSTVPQTSSSGFLPFIVCPYPLQQTSLSWEHFTVTMNASWRYGFLPLTFCEINPLITTSLVSYSNGVINTTVISSRSLDGGSSNLTQLLAAIVNHQSVTTQGLTTNAIGDALYAIYVSASGKDSISAEELIDLLLGELEQYWRGVIEFSGTFLRSAFSAYPREVPAEAQIPVSGHETIVAMGWYRQSAIWGFTIFPITAVALMMYAAVAYTLWHVFTAGCQESFDTFDPSNPIHVMMVSSTRDSNDTKDNLDDSLAGFERGGIARNEELRVQLTNVVPYRKRFRAITEPDWYVAAI